MPADPALPAAQPDSASDATSSLSDDWDDMLQPVDHGNKRQQQVWLIQQVGLVGCVGVGCVVSCAGGEQKQDGSQHGSSSRWGLFGGGERMGCTRVARQGLHDKGIVF